MAVHDVVVQPVGTGFFHALRVCAEGAEVGGEERRRDENHNETSNVIFDKSIPIKRRKIKQFPQIAHCHAKKSFF